MLRIRQLLKMFKPLRCFVFGNVTLLVPAFVVYVRPILEYVCPSVCVCLSHSGIVSKQLNVGSRK